MTSCQNRIFRQFVIRSNVRDVFILGDITKNEKLNLWQKNSHINVKVVLLKVLNQLKPFDRYKNKNLFRKSITDC